MADREKVIQSMEDSLKNQHCGFIEDVGNVYAVSEEIINETLELLKEAVKPKWYKGIPFCGVCARTLDHCPFCGRRVAWLCDDGGSGVKRND